MTSPLDDPLITTVGRLMEAASRLQRSLGQALESRAGVPLSWFEVLLRLSRSTDRQQAMGVLAEQLVLTTGGMTRLVDRMQAAGLVDRKPCPTDRRILYAHLTDAGLAKLEQAAVVHCDEVEQVFDGFAPHEVAALDHMLDRLRGVS